MAREGARSRGDRSRGSWRGRRDDDGCRGRVRHRRHWWRARRVRHGALRRRSRAVGRHRRAGQGRRHLPAPGMRARQGVPRDRRRVPHGRFGRGLRRPRGRAALDFSVSQDRKNGVVDKLFKGLVGAVEGPPGHDPLGHGHARGRSPGARPRRRGCRTGADRHERRPGGGVGATDPSRARGRRSLGHDLRRVPRPQRGALAGRRRRRRRHRVRVRLAPRRPRVPR